MSESFKHPVIQHLESLAGEDHADRAALAKLRRALQNPIEAYPIILPYLPHDVSDNDLSLYAMLAGLFANHPQIGGSGNMGNHMREAAGENVEATERRFVNLLRSNLEDLPILLRQSVSFLRSKNNIPVDWEQLRRDLFAWDHPQEYVQKNWARAFWSSHASNDAKETQNQNQ
jgi:CRISPR system Cascade subunit CasB